MNQTTDLIEKINEICPNDNRRHSYFQLQYFVVGKEPTIQAKLQSCKTEMSSRRDHILATTLEIEELLDKKRLEQLAIEKIKSSTENDKLLEVEQILIRQHRRKIVALEDRIGYLQRDIRAKEDEANFLIGLYEKLSSIESEKDWNSLEVQCEYWNAKLTREIEARLIMGQLPNVEDFKTVMSLPSGMPVRDITNKLISDKSEAVKKLTQP